MSSPSSSSHAHHTDALSRAIADIRDVTRARELTRRWLDYVHSSSFRDVVRETFAQCAKAKSNDDALDVTELRFAVDVLHEKLNVMAHGRLPKVNADASALMREFDADASATLDAEEFHRFAMCYFSRLEWPLWRVCSRGAALGVGIFIAHEVWINPLMQRFVKVVAPRVIGKIRKDFEKQLSGVAKTHWSKLMIKMSDGKFFGDSENETRELERLERRRRRGEFLKKARAWLVAAAVGGASAAAGFL